MGVYLDACVLIYRVDGSAAFQVAAAAAFESIGRDDADCISDLVLLECLVKPFRITRRRSAEEARGELRGGVE